MIDLDELLTRRGLDAPLRLLILLEVHAANGNRDAVEAIVARARDAGQPRSELEETLLQGVLFYGFPRSVTAFDVLNRCWPVEAAPHGGALPRDRWPTAGRELFDAIYDQNAPAVHAMLRSFHVDFHDFVIESAYGRILARPGLDPRRRELLAVGALATFDQLPQLVAHARGARRFGATDEELREVLVTALGDRPVIDQHMRRIS